MEIGSKIHDKLITDFQALKFSNNTNIFNNVKKFFTSSMVSMDCVIMPQSTPEDVQGQSAGNYQTTRMYTYSATVIEQIESSISDTAAGIKYARLENIQDSILDYLQKEPSNLNSWGDTNGINVFKIRVNNCDYRIEKAESGYVVALGVIFTIFVNVIPQNL